MASTVPQNPTPQNVLALLPKVSDPDSDYRFMALNDLAATLNNGHQNFLSTDYTTCCRVVDGLLKALQDSHGDVQNMAIKCIGPFLSKAAPDVINPMLEKLSTLNTGGSVDNSIPMLALREAVVSLPRPTPGLAFSPAVTSAYQAISRVVIVRLVGYTVVQTKESRDRLPPKGLLQADIENNADSNAIDVLIAVANCFGPTLKDTEVEALQKVTSEIMDHERTGSVMRKKAVAAIATLATYFSDALLSSYMSGLVEKLRQSRLTPAKRKLYLSILSSMARTIPRKFGPYLRIWAPYVLSAVSEDSIQDQYTAAAEDEERDPQSDEVLETAFVALESFLASCTSDMRAYVGECISASLRFLSYNPNRVEEADDAMGDSEEDETDDLEIDEDFEEDDAFDEEDDSSWKVRRCAAKTLSAIIVTRAALQPPDNEALYDRVAPALISRFKDAKTQEIEENVKVEILTTLTHLVHQLEQAQGVSQGWSVNGTEHSSMPPPPTRKRRRGDSDASMFEPHSYLPVSSGFTSPIATEPSSTEARQLAKLGPEMLRGISRLLKEHSAAVKQACVHLLKAYVSALPGGVSDQLSQLVDPLVEAIQGHAGRHVSAVVSGGFSAAGSTLRIEALNLIAAIAETHSSTAWLPYLPKIVPVLVAAAKDRYSKVSSEAIGAIQETVKALTPPRSASSSDTTQSLLDQLYQVLLDQISANDSDLEVRRRAIGALSMLLARTSGSKGTSLLSSDKRREALELLLDRVRNETTRLASVKAIDTVAALAQQTSEVPGEWVQPVVLELGMQLRKASRALRGASLASLRALIVNPAARQSLDQKTIKQIVQMLLPLITAEDLHLLGPALVIIAALVKETASKGWTQAVLSAEFSNTLCQLVTTNLSGAALDALLLLMKNIGETGKGLHLMQNLLRVGVGGNTTVSGRVIGTLVATGEGSVGVKLEDFTLELNKLADEKRKCLALAVLGEAGFRKGTLSPLQPKLFLSHFNEKSDQVRLAAAVALGRAAATNVGNFLPSIMKSMSQPSSPRYLLLHSIRELLQHSQSEDEIRPQASELWHNLVAASQTEDNKTVGAECIGRLAIINPTIYLPSLLVSSSKAYISSEYFTDLHQDFLEDNQSAIRGMAILSLRYTFADTDEAYDDFLRPSIVKMLKSMLNDHDLENRRQALTTFNSAIQNKPHLVFPSPTSSIH